MADSKPLPPFDIIYLSDSGDCPWQMDPLTPVRVMAGPQFMAESTDIIQLQTHRTSDLNPSCVAFKA